MIVVESLPVEQSAAGPTEHIEMDWHQRQKHRQKCTTNTGTEVALALPRGTLLSNETVIYNTPERTVVIRSAQQSVVVVRVKARCKPAKLRTTWATGGLAVCTSSMT